jgi:putative transposase
MAKRRAIQHTVSEGMGTIRQGCRALGLQVSSFYKAPLIGPEKKLVQEAIKTMSMKHPRYGYRRITAMLQRDGCEVGKDRVQRFRRVQGLQVKKRQRKLRRLGISTAERQRATHPRHVWSWDIIQDSTETGGAFKMLTILDEYSRECLKIWPSWSIRACDVIKQLEEAMEVYGEPEHLRSDNGSEFIAYAVQDWLGERAIKSIYIRPGSPWENPYIESFHDKLRDELLNRELFSNLLEARVLTENWRREYNEIRPHSSLGYKTPMELAAGLNNFKASYSQSVGLTRPLSGGGSTNTIDANEIKEHSANLYIRGVH